MSSKPASITPELLLKHGDLNLKINKDSQISGDETIDKSQSDFKREMLFYRQAQTTVIEGIKLLQTKYGLKTSRPEDYFAEMAKSDDHMTKVRQRLQTKQNSIEDSEKAKKLRELKKYGKKVQQEVHLKRQAEKRDMLQKIQNFKKGSGESIDFLDDENFGDGENKKKKGAAKNSTSNNKPSKLTKKQKYKNARYGYGGQKKRSKYNDSESAANMSSFSARKHGRPKLAGKKGSAKRPGKSVRQKNKSRK